MSTRIDNQKVISNYKESYFVQNTPAAFDSPQFMSSSRDGKFIYALKFKYNIRLVQHPDAQLPEIVTELESSVVCKYHLFSGKYIDYDVDEELVIAKLIRIVEFYTLFENIVVVLIYEPDKYQFSQYVMHLDGQIRKALIVVSRMFTITRIVGPPFINLALIEDGKLIICGVRGTEEGERKIRMTICIPSDPLIPGKDEDLSNLMEDFNQFLKAAWKPDFQLPDGLVEEKAMSLFLLSMDDDRITVILSDVSDSQSIKEPTLLTEIVGRIDRKTGKFSIDKLDDSEVRHAEYLKVTSLTSLKIRKQNVWLSFSIVDIEKLKTFKWRMRHVYVRFVLRLMIYGFQGCLYLWRYDNGASFTLLTRFLQWAHGPSMLPIFNPDKKFYLYYLDLKRDKFHAIKHDVVAQPEKENPNETLFALNFDVDSSGGAFIVNFPNSSKASMTVSYYPNPTKPPSLSRLSMFSAYKYYPTFEKSSLLRRLTGVLDWQWTI